MGSMWTAWMRKWVPQDHKKMHLLCLQNPGEFLCIYASNCFLFMISPCLCFQPKHSNQPPGICDFYLSQGVAGSQPGWPWVVACPLSRSNFAQPSLRIEV